MANITEYDLSFWIKQNVDETNAQKVCDGIVQKLQDKGFVIVSSTVPVLKTFGQMVNKEAKAYLATIIFGLGTGDLAGIKDVFAFNSDILRFMTVRKDIRQEKPRAKRSRLGRKPEYAEKENTEVKTVCDPITPLTNEEKVEEIKEQIIEENEEAIVEGNTQEEAVAEEKVIEEKIEEEVVTDGPTTPIEEKEIDLNELDKKLDELLK